MKFILVFLSLTATAETYDCSQFKPFVPIDTLKADISIYRLNKFVSDGNNEPVEEEVCSTKAPVVVLVKDIRGKEADWYYCDKPAAENFISCDAEYKGKPAKIYVKPAMVIRRWKPADALDTHMHVNLLPENDDKKYHLKWLGWWTRPQIGSRSLLCQNKGL